MSEFSGSEVGGLSFRGPSFRDTQYWLLYDSKTDALPRTGRFLSVR